MTAYRGRRSLLKPPTGEVDDRPILVDSKTQPETLVFGPRAADETLCSALDAFLAGQNREALVHSDPVELVRVYQDPHDQEVAGLFVASLAYGRVASIRAAASRVLAALGDRPARAIDAGRFVGLEGFVYRFQRDDDMPALARAIRGVRAEFGSLGSALLALDPGGADYAAALDRWVETLRARGQRTSRGFEFLLPRVNAGAAKRLWLYLRWMIRAEDGIDLGTWRTFGSFDPGRLLVPIDTHVQRIARYVGLTDRASSDLVMAREVTGNLARLRPGDPVAYDMALCHLGVSGSCPRRRDPVRCVGCPIRAICRLGEPPLAAPASKEPSKRSSRRSPSK